MNGSLRFITRKIHIVLWKLFLKGAKNMKNFLSKPITWGASIKVTTICMGLTALICAIYYVVDYCDLVEKVISKIRK